MLDDPRFQKLVYFFFFGSLAAAIIMVGTVVFTRYGEIERAARPEGSPIELREKNGRFIVPEEELPSSLEEKLRAPSISLLPSRAETLGSSPAPDSVEKTILDSTQNFLQKWERFRPGPSPYGQRLRSNIKQKSSLSILRRNDVSSIGGLCLEPKCSFGSELAGKPELSLSDYDGRRAHVVGYGVIRAIGNSPGRLYNQSYGILLQRTGKKWLVTRAAAETLGAVEDV